jgi:RNA 3'-terminal phosphate cyclase
MSGIAPPEGHTTFGERNQAMVGYGYAMRVPAKVAEHVFSAAERALGIHHPVVVEQRAQQGGEGLGILERCESTVKTEFAAGVQGSEARHELTAKDAAERLHRQKKRCCERIHFV